MFYLFVVLHHVAAHCVVLHSVVVIDFVDDNQLGEKYFEQLLQREGVGIGGLHQ